VTSEHQKHNNGYGFMNCVHVYIMTFV